MPVEMSQERCRELMTAGIVGRIALTTPEGPHVVPINYVCVDESIVFRAAPDSLVGRHGPGQVVAFEVDRINYDDHTGWSVLAIGPCREVEDLDELRARTPFWKPRPWVSGERTVYLQIDCERLTGRQVGGVWTYDNEVPVRSRT